MTPDQRLAEIWHWKDCRYNHTDGCSWGYESWEEPKWARTKYLEAVGKLTPEERQSIEDWVPILRPHEVMDR